MTTENRWARPTMTEVEWMNDDLPAVFSEERVRRTLDTATDGAFMLVPTDPVLHCADDPDGGEKAWFWMVGCLIVTRADYLIHGFRLTSVAMHEQGDLAEEVRDDFARQVISFVRKTGQGRVIHV